VGAGDDGAYGVKLQPDGKIVVVGYSSNGANKDFALVRYETDGSEDVAVTTPLGAGDDEAFALALQADGKIVAAGSTANGTDNDFALARYETDGTQDTTFGGDGEVTTDIEDDFAQAVTVQPDGRIVAAGFTDLVAFPGNARFAVARYGTDGSLDASFGAGGTVLTTVGQSISYASGIALQTDGKFVLAGSGVDGHTVFGVARYIADGTAPTDPTLSSSSHSVSAWSTDRTVDVGWSGATDDWSGVDGFSALWSTSATTSADEVKEAEETADGDTSPDLTDGAHYVHLRTADNIGNWSDGARLGPFWIDATAPAARTTGRALSRRFQPRRSFRARWSASDAASGAVSYSVRYRRARFDGDFGPLREWQSDVTATTATLQGTPGSTYCLSAGATDLAGNEGLFGSERCTAVPANDSQLSRSGPWLRGSGRGYYLGSYRASWTRGASLSLPVAAKRLKLVATKCPQCGVVEVRLGSKTLARVDLHASTWRKRRMLEIATFERVRRGTLRIEVVSSGELVLIEGLGISRT
jgi:uncharacterized delta-60 repeat protein